MASSLAMLNNEKIPVTASNTLKIPFAEEKLAVGTVVRIVAVTATARIRDSGRRHPQRLTVP